MEGILDRAAVGFSYVLEAVAFVFHAWTMMVLRVKAQQAQYELSLQLWREHRALCDVIAVIKRMERDVAEADLALEASRRVAVEAFRVGIERLRRDVRESVGDGQRRVERD